MSKRGFVFLMLSVLLFLGCAEDPQDKDHLANTNDPTGKDPDSSESLCPESPQFSPCGETPLLGEHPSIYVDCACIEPKKSCVGQPCTSISTCTCANAYCDTDVGICRFAFDYEHRGGIRDQYIGDVAVSGNGKLIAISSGDVVRIFETKSQEEIRSIYPVTPTALTFSEDGRNLYYADRTIDENWNVYAQVTRYSIETETITKAVQLLLKDQKILGMHLSSNEKYLVVAGCTSSSGSRRILYCDQANTQIIDLETETTFYTRNYQDEYLRQNVAFSPSGKQVAIAVRDNDDREPGGQIFVMDLESREVLFGFSRVNIRDVLYSPDGAWIITSRIEISSKSSTETVIHAYDSQSGELVWTRPAIRDSIVRLEPLVSNKILGLGNSTIYEWEIAENGAEKTYDFPYSIGREFTLLDTESMTFFGVEAYVDNAGIFTLEDETSFVSINGTNYSALFGEISPDGEWYSSLEGTRLLEWNLSTGKKRYTTLQGASQGNPLSPSKGPIVYEPQTGRIALGFHDSIIVLDDQRKEVGTVSFNSAQSIAFSEDGTQLVASNQEATVTWNLDEFKQTNEFIYPEKVNRDPFPVALSGDGNRVAVPGVGSVIVYNVEEGTKLVEFPVIPDEPEFEPGLTIISEALSQQGTYLSVCYIQEEYGGDNDGILFNVSTEEVIAKTGICEGLDFSDDEKIAVFGSVGGVYFFQTSSGERIKVIQTHYDWLLSGPYDIVSSVALAPDLSFLVSEGYPGSTMIFDISGLGEK